MIMTMMVLFVVVAVIGTKSKQKDDRLIDCSYDIFH